MRKGTTLTYMLSDHLGSTSLVTNASGNVLSETRYTAWGELRYQAGTTSTGYTYTGQYSNAADFGLMYYNARWYDPYLNHFTQPDIIVPNPSNPQDWDRYAYARNNPIRYTDPSGHSVDCGLGEFGCNAGVYTLSTEYQLGQFGVSTDDGTEAQNQSTLQAAQLAGDKLASVIGGGISAQDAFRRAHGDISIKFGSDISGCITENYSSYNTITCGSYLPDYLTQNILHEFGHVFDNHFQLLTGVFASGDISESWNGNEGGYICKEQPCMMHSDYEFSKLEHGLNEELGDMYMNWVLQGNMAFPDNGFDITGGWEIGDQRSAYINGHVGWPNSGMPNWLRRMFQ